MKFCSKSGCFLGAFAVLSLGMPPAVSARTTDQNKTLGSAPDVYRIEVRNLRTFKVLETGDNDGTAELEFLRVVLASYSGSEPPVSTRQFDEYTESYTTLFNRTTNSGAGNSPVGVRLNDFVTFAGREVSAGARNLWIHSRRIRKPSGEIVPINLQFIARERDCTRNRDCARGSIGSVTIEFTIPEFATPPSQDCNSSNTFQLTTVDGELQLLGIDSERVRTHSERSFPFPLLTKHKKGGPRLMPFNADICIASTKLP